MQPAHLAQPGDEVVIKMLVAHGAEVNGPAQAEGVHRQGRPAGIKILGISRQNLAALRLDDVAPEPGGMHVAGGKRAFEREMIFLAGRNGIEFQHFQPEQIRHVVRITGVGRDAVFVDQAGVEGADERAAVLDVKFQTVGLAGGQQVQRRRENDLVLRQVLGRPRKIHGNVAIMQRVVDELNVLAQVEKFVGLHRLLQRPIVVVGVKDAGLRDDLGVLERGREQFQFLADLADFLEDAVVAFEVVRQDRAVKFFVADARLAPAIIKHAARAAGNELIGEQPDDARAAPAN